MTLRAPDDIDLLCAAGDDRWELAVVLSINVALLRRVLQPRKEVARIEERRTTKNDHALGMKRRLR
jgi:hypothetical protein